LVRTQTYDSDGRPLSITATDPASSATLQKLQFAWTTNNDLASIINGRSTSLSQTFAYDGLGRMTSAARGDGVTESFGYDAVGNRTSYGRSGQPSVTLGYEPTSNHLLSASQRIWTYNGDGDSNGFIGADGVAVGLSYDAFGRIASSSRQNQTTAYLVNALGQRVSKVGPAGTNRFIYSPDGILLAEFGPAGWTDYVYGYDELLGRIRGNSVGYVHTDQVGRPELITDGSKATVWSASNYAFDRSVSLDQIGGMNIGFPGQYYEQETGLWQNLNREYDSSTGRYIQSDPLGLEGGQNTYLYAEASPANLTDPTGLLTPLAAAWKVAACALGAGSGYLTVDSVKAFQRDWEKGQEKQAQIRAANPCPEATTATHEGEKDQGLRDGAAAVGNTTNAGASFFAKGAAFVSGMGGRAISKWALSPVGNASRLGGAAAPACFLGGVGLGLFGPWKADGSASDWIDQKMKDFNNYMQSKGL
jgi:RHS repeat-associated protein